MRYHGNYCGPNWSAGENQESVRDPSVPAVDELDACCLEHDGEYYDGGDLVEADFAFAECAIDKGVKGAVAAILVGMQGTGRKALRGNKPNSKAGAKSAPASSGTKMAPVAKGTRLVARAPRVNQVKDGVSISHRALLGAIPGSTTYRVWNYSCNPGMSLSFPWLAKLAAKFEKYRFKRLTYEFRSVCSTAEQGVLMFSFDYDALDSIPPNKTEQSQTIPNSEANVWMNNTLEVKCDNQWRFVRQGTVAGSDLKTYDFGTMFASVSYGGSANTVGELYVNYEVELKNPTPGRESVYQFIGTSPFTTGNLFNSGTEYGMAPPCHKVDGKTLKFTQAGEYLLTLVMASTTAGTIATWLQPTVTGYQCKRIMDIGSGGQFKASSWAFRIEAGGTLITDSSFTAGNVNTIMATVTVCDYDSLMAV